MTKSFESMAPTSDRDIISVKQEGLLYITQAYESSSGDTWDLVRDDATSRMHVKHTPNLASGGQSSEMALEHFLRIEPHSPQHQAISALVSADSDSATKIKGYVHAPKEEGGPYIAVVPSPDGEPTVDASQVVQGG